MKKKKEKSDSKLDKASATLKSGCSPKKLTGFIMQAMELDIHEVLFKRYKPGVQLRPFINVVAVDSSKGFNKERIIESLSTTRSLEIPFLSGNSKEKVEMFRTIGNDYIQNFPGDLPVAVYFVSEVYAKTVEPPKGFKPGDLPLEEVANLAADVTAIEAIMIAGLSVDKQLRVTIIPLSDAALSKDFASFEPEVLDLNKMDEANKAGVPMLSAFFQGASMAIHGDEKGQTKKSNLDNFLKMSIN